ncbi:hypothetical protein Bca52824_044205 [Brassica carinata]|uniref:Uncharacterized protein n=1 Tax=Brassica carinata TaxID=52824 RepID=A0A8X7S0Z6_BRACI|nr:hypothetical protein Bca52824_044205 [Brassica carinata]
MGLLDHLWDDTVAGPRPENGLGKLRRHHTFSFRPSSGNDQSDGGSVRSYGGDSPEEAVKVTRSIMIIKPPGYQGGSAPVSPAGSTPPVSPFSDSVFRNHQEPSATGPTYSNSPPPTSVPIPKFSFRQKRTAFPVFDSAVEITEVSNSAPVSPTSSGDNPFHSTVSATMTLRRMLNLDPGDECRSGGFRGTWIRF